MVVGHSATQPVRLTDKDGMHFRDEQQAREHRVTHALAQDGPLHRELVDAIGIQHTYTVDVEFNKALFGKVGDVDLVFWVRPNDGPTELIAVEVKVMLLDSDGSFRSEKKHKHVRQLQQLQTEGWHRIFLLDVIVTQPAEGWLHPQAISGRDQFTKEVINKDAGHLVMQINSVANKPEEDAGSASCCIRKPAAFLESHGTHRDAILEALKRLHSRENVYFHPTGS